MNSVSVRVRLSVRISVSMKDRVQCVRISVRITGGIGLTFRFCIV